MTMNHYAKFAAMIATSTVMMFGLMYLNVYSGDHAYWSETRAHMALIMGATMAVVILLFMLGMYTSMRLNMTVLAVSAIVFAGSLYLVRSQATVADVAWMKAMIPHHSIAILTSRRATITDPRVKDLAGRIIEAQEREIGEMKGLIADLQAKK
jgi:uncharacterized protein (DUF305 family)